jgi:hypothetical protein
VLAVWAMFGAVAFAVFITYSWLPAHDRYHVDTGGIAGGAGRALVFLAFPTALVAIPIALLAAAHLRTRSAWVAAIVAVVLSATVAIPGNVDEADLDAKPLNAVTAAGAGLALALTAAAWRSGASRRWGRVAGDRLRLAVAAVLVAGSLPWIFAEVGVYIDDIPLLGLLFTSDEPSPTGEGPVAVHLGHHHGQDGTLLAISALLLTRPLQRMSRSGLRELLALYLSILLVYGLGNALQDFWLEQFVKRDWVDWRIPEMLRPEPEPVWALIATLGFATYAALWARPRSSSRASSAP